MNDTTKPSEISNALQCKGCGALLHFLPGTHNLQCDYCGENNPIEQTAVAGAVTSVDFDEYIASIDKNRQADTHKIVDCNNCGSRTVLDSFVASDKCPFCASPLVLNLESGLQYVTPHYILPFQVTKQQASDFFKNWLNGLWWAPNDLAKKVGNSSSVLNGVYLPHWTYDTNTITEYTGERGDYYYTTETYTEEVNGRTETRTRQVRHTSWSYASGTVDCEFRDLIVPASKSLPEPTLIKLEPWKFNDLVKFDERYTSGFRSETYQLDPDKGFLKAVEQTVPEINNAIRNDIGGDEQRINNTETQYNNKAIKYIMLPVWVSAYNYNNKIYQFAVNASTGEVIGERPLSYIKIAFAIILGIALIIAAIVFFQAQNT